VFSGIGCQLYDGEVWFHLIVILIFVYVNMLCLIFTLQPEVHFSLSVYLA